VDPTDPGGKEAGKPEADVLCIESNYLQSEDARKMLAKYLADGRGVVLLINRVTPVIKGALQELGFTAEEPILRAPGEEEKFQFVLPSHRIFHPFVASEYGNLMTVKVRAYQRLHSSEAIPLIFSEKGAGLFFQSTRYQGKLFVAAFGFDREHSSWPTHPTFIPFLDLTLQAARTRDSSQNAFEPGESVDLQVNANVPSGPLILSDEYRELGRFPVHQGRARVQMPSRPGLYPLREPSGRIERLIAVNVPSKESALNFADPTKTLDQWKTKSTDLTFQTRSQPALVPMPVILQQRFWWWMLLAGLVALMAEMALAAVRKEKAV
jgi:hypothetical protein